MIARTKNKWMVQVAPIPGKIPPGAEAQFQEPIDVVVEAYWATDGVLTEESVVDAARVMTWWKIYSTTGMKVPFMPTAEPVLLTT